MSALAMIAMIICGCTKEKEVIEKPEIEQSITYLHHYYDAANKYVKTDTAWHQCRVCCEDLARFRSYEKISYYACDASRPNDILELNIGKACAKSTK